MEMHEIRYFLAVARTLNFTRAADECNVAQPSLTRAIKKLELELGGDLLRRERNNSQLTDLGHSMLPHFKRCYESALSAKELATSYKKGNLAPFSLAISQTIDMSLVAPPLKELAQHISALELDLFRGTGAQIVDRLKNGESELAIAGPIGDDWERLDIWPLLSEPFHLVVNTDHPFAQKNAVDSQQLSQERLLARPYCEQATYTSAFLRDHNVLENHSHQVSSERDLIALLEANVGIALLPKSTPLSNKLRAVMLMDLELNRTISVYGVSGRQRSMVASLFLKLLRAIEWPATTT